MPDLFVWSLDKTQKERLTGYGKDLVRKWKVNNLNSISFSVSRNDLNKRAFDLMEEKCQIEYDGTKYTIEELDKSPMGDTVVADVSCEHVFFDEFMNRTYVYTALAKQKRSLNEYMNFIIPKWQLQWELIQNLNYMFHLISLIRHMQLIYKYLNYFTLIIENSKANYVETN